MKFFNRNTYQEISTDEQIIPVFVQEIVKSISDTPKDWHPTYRAFAVEGSKKSEILGITDGKVEVMGMTYDRPKVYIYNALIDQNMGKGCYGDHGQKALSKAVKNWLANATIDMMKDKEPTSYRHEDMK